MYKWIWGYIKKYRFWMATGLTLSAIVAAMNVINPIITGNIVPAMPITTRIRPALSIRSEVRWDASTGNVSKIYWPQVPENPQKTAAAMAMTAPVFFFISFSP